MINVTIKPAVGEGNKKNFPMLRRWNGHQSVVNEGKPMVVLFTSETAGVVLSGSDPIYCGTTVKNLIGCSNPEWVPVNITLSTED